MARTKLTSGLAVALFSLSRLTMAQPTVPGGQDHGPTPAAPTPNSPTPPAPTDTPPAQPTVQVVIPPVGANTATAAVQEMPTMKDAPQAGWHNGLFYLRSKDDNFRLYIQGRAQIDSYNYFGAGVQHTTLKSTLFLRRLRPELSGEFFKHWQWMLAGDWGATSFDNPRGTNELAAANAGANPTSATARYAPAQTAGIRALATDAFLNYRANSLFNIQVGQFDAPFTMENRTSDKYLPFMERSIAIRSLGIPTNKELGAMFWGEAQSRLFFYSVGIFDGDGQGRLNPDNRVDVMGRAFVHPLISRKDPLRDLQIGASIRYGRRDPNYVLYDYGGLSTQGGFTFFNPNYNSSKGFTRVMPAGAQLGVAGELRIPVSIVDLTSEFVYVNNGTRESVDGTESTNTERFGNMHGYGYYVQVGVWLLGQRDANGLPGYENPAHLDLNAPANSAPPHALQLLAKFEQVNVKYDSANRSGAVDAKTNDGTAKANVVSFGVNYWYTRHIRLTANYVADMFPDSTFGGEQTASQRAVSPGNTIAAGLDDKARKGAHTLHELLFRMGLAF